MHLYFQIMWLHHNDSYLLQLFGHKTNTFQNQHQQQLKEFRAKQIEKELIDLLLVGNQVGGANGAFDNMYVDHKPLRTCYFRIVILLLFILQC